MENNSMFVTDKNGSKIEVSVLGMFEIPDLNKKYVMYGLLGENPDNGAVMLGEAIGEGENMQIVGILPEEKEIVVAYYNEISTQLGEE